MNSIGGYCLRARLLVYGSGNLKANIMTDLKMRFLLGAILVLSISLITVKFQAVDDTQLESEWQPQGSFEVHLFFEQPNGG